MCAKRRQEELFNKILKKDKFSYLLTLLLLSSLTICNSGCGYVWGSVTWLSATSPLFTWSAGSDTLGQLGLYGTKGTGSTANYPGARQNSAGVIDSSGNLWIFGGFSYPFAGGAGPTNDLWKYAPSTGQWTWLSGSHNAYQSGAYVTSGTPNAGNLPGARYSHHMWIDRTGNLWIFGGYGYDHVGSFGSLNDLWEYSVGLGQWIWWNGSNTVNPNGTYGSVGSANPLYTPGGRLSPAGWIDSANNLWLFGGSGYDSVNVTTGVLNDLWEYSTVSNQWTFWGGSNLINQSGNYGPQGVPGAGYIPSARQDPAYVSDLWGNFWLFGGNGVSGAQNDLWKFNPISLQWTWAKGSNQAAQSGSYGTQGVASPQNGPGGRYGSAMWCDLHGNLWLFGGGYFTSVEYNFNDFWKYDQSGMWTWKAGSSGLDQGGIYGTLGLASSRNIPGGRNGNISWTDGNGLLWLFGGGGYDSLGSKGNLNDLWSVAPQ